MSHKVWNSITKMNLEKLVTPRTITPEVAHSSGSLFLRSRANQTTLKLKLNTSRCLWMSTRSDALNRVRLGSFKLLIKVPGITRTAICWIRHCLEPLTGSQTMKTTKTLTIRTQGDRLIFKILLIKLSHITQPWMSKGTLYSQLAFQKVWVHIRTHWLIQKAKTRIL